VPVAGFVVVYCVLSIFPGRFSGGIGPFTDDADVRRGQEVFITQCAACHEYGEARRAPDLAKSSLPRLLIRLQVRLGMGAMPKFDRQQVSRQDMEILMRYLLRMRLTGQPISAGGGGS
jgi:mono/diheme cytochrome c family protein